MRSRKGDEEVHDALETFLDDARPLAIERGLATFHQRLAAIQDGTVVTDGGNDFDEFFGTSNPTFFGIDGTVTRLM